MVVQPDLILTTINQLLHTLGRKSILLPIIQLKLQKKPNVKRLVAKPLSLIVMGVFLSVSVGSALSQSEKKQEIELEIGIVQRFGENAPQSLTVTSVQGDTLNLKLKTTNNQQKTIKTPKLTLEVAMQPLDSPLLQEKLVLGDHATFETAEDNAQKWQKRGISVEVTQPGRWQVWAKPEIYPTPLLRRLLLNSLQNQGYSQPLLDTQILREKPTISVLVNDRRYQSSELEISTTENLVKVAQEDQPATLYGGSLKLQANSYGNFSLINKVSLETYLRGVVPHEIGPNAPQQAIQAQTIIARTYALRNLRRFKADGYQLCANQHCQVYRGLTETISQVDRAIAATKGLVLIYNNELVDALYSSTTGGITASFSDIWNGEERPYLKSVIDAPTPMWNLLENPLASEANFRRFISLKRGFNETGRSVFRWNKISTLEELTADLQLYLENTKHPLAKISEIDKMEVTKRSPSGRILTMQVYTDLGVVELYKTEVRSAFGPPRSTLFYLEPVYQEEQSPKILKGYAFVGGGFGHGVGLSQYGSYNLAKLGWSAAKILSFYYPGTTLQPLNDKIIFYPEKN